MHSLNTDVSIAAADRDCFDAAVSKALQGSPQVVQALLEISQNDDSTAAARVSAARVLLELAFQGMQLQDLARRLAEVEQLLAQPAGH